MTPLRLVAIFALVTSCVRQESPAYDTYPEPISVAGPPSGEIDPAWTQDQYTGEPAAYPDGYAEGYADQSVEPSSDPTDAGYVMGSVTDAEIDMTLDAYGEWVDNGEYGRVWRPYATAVGVDFTPYESCGSWVWTDWGWTFACDWDWGWLPFHYGRWGWYDDYWAWQPDYEWSPGWVEWRGGGGYVGWRPLGPTVRDHRNGHGGPTFHDHRNGVADGSNIRDHRKHRSMDSQWRFAANKDFGKRIKPNLFRAPAEGLRLTSTVTRPPVRPNYQPVHVASLMRGRLALRDSIGVRSPRTPQAAPMTDTSGGRRPVWGGRMGGRVGGPVPGRTFNPPSGVAGGTPSVYAPTYPTYQPPQPQRPSRGSPPRAGFDAPDRVATPPSHTRPSFDDHPSRPSRPSFDGGSSSPPPRTRPSFDPHPSRPSFGGGSSAPPPRPRPSFDSRPSRPAVDRAPSRPTWTPPSSPPPSRGSSGSSGNWSPPSRPSSSSSSSSHSSPPSRPSSSSSSSSRGSSSGSSYSPPSRSSSSSSSSSSGSSRSSGGGWGGGGGGSRNHRR